MDRAWWGIQIYRGCMQVVRGGVKTKALSPRCTRIRLGDYLPVRWNVHLFSQRTRLGLVRKSYPHMGLQNGTSSGIGKTHISFVNEFNWVERIIVPVPQDFRLNDT